MAGLTLKQDVIHLTKPPEQLAQEFEQLQSFEEIALLLEISPMQLYHFTHTGRKYHEFQIPKKHGGLRTINAPGTGLKFVQHKLNQVLQAAYSPNSAVHGFVKNRDVVTNAALHVRRRFVLNIDLENFFETITFPRVRGMFVSKPYCKNPTVATILARLCCFKGVLAQGAPTSPVISNMLLARMDSQLKVLARKHKCTYSRYADDITFSTFTSRFPRALAHFLEEESGGALNIGSALNDVVASNGFSINPSKTRLQHASRRQVVTGLTANRFPNVPQEFVRQVRAMLHDWSKSTLPKAAKTFFECHDYKKRFPTNMETKFVQVVKGKINYIGMVRGRESRTHLKLLAQYASLNPTYAWPSDLPPHELDLKILEAAVFALEGDHSQGTAFNLANVGLVTCAHVVEEQGPLSVRRQDSHESFPVQVISIDKDRDLALLKFSSKYPKELPKFEMSNEVPEKLDQVVLMGYPTAGPSLSSTIDQGAITGHYVRFGQTRHSISCTIYQGNSGGPVLDRNYRLIGVAANGIEKKDPKLKELMGVIPTSILAEFLSESP